MQTAWIACIRPYPPGFSRHLFIKGRLYGADPACVSEVIYKNLRIEKNNLCYNTNIKISFSGVHPVSSHFIFYK